MLNTYEIIRELGRGQHGKVKLGRDLTTGDFVAIKIMNRTGRPRLGRPMRPGSTQEDKIRREIAILKTCNHPHIVRLREVLDDSNSNKIFLVLEYVELGEIKWTTEDGNPAMTVDYARSIFRDVVLGLEYLHYKGIIHRDIKPANLLMTSEGNAKISDFGVSYISGLSGEDDELELAKTAGTPAFFAPELCYNDPDLPRPQITNKIDIWALGVTLFCLIYGKCPFTADNEFELFNVIAKEPVVFPDNVDLPDEAKNLILNLLEKNPDKRMSIAEIKKNPWVLEGMTDDKRTEFLSQALLSR
ncbi:kinase-like domain-containing protein [Myxozyma melibiosi]|uniref:Kinase-like domain-containing protein n=1 Tax=Myxozyma melibiosi TaxID=54550 RepID=A0ABR1F6I7_9ASCO